MFNRKCKITFISHGSTVFSEENRITDKLDYPPLNDNGYEEMNKIVQFIKKRGLKTDNIYCSPQLCCVQSAEILADELKQDFKILTELTNRKCGEWSGLTFDKIEKSHPEMLKNLQYNPMDCCPKNGEKIEDFNTRVNSVIEQIINENLRGRVIVVTSPSIIQSAIKNALDFSPKAQYRIYIKNASATQISYFTDWASLVYSDYTPL